MKSTVISKSLIARTATMLLLAVFTSTTAWSQSLSGKGTSDSPYLITNADDWGSFVGWIEAGTNTNKCYKLTNDIEVSTMVGTSDHNFTGTFDGNGHTISVTLVSDNDYCGLFCRTYGATIMNLTTAGSVITHARYAGGVVGRNGTANLTMTNVKSSASIYSSYSGEACNGGLVGYAISATFKGCAFTGSIGGPDCYRCGGLLGWKSDTDGTSASFTDCLFAPENVTAGASKSMPFAGYSKGTVNCTNCYYLSTALGTSQGKLAHSIKAGDYVTMDLAGTPTTYNVSGIISYGTGIKYSSVFHAGSGDVLSLTLGHDDLGSDYVFSGYVSDKAAIIGDNNPYQLTMPDTDVTIKALWNLTKVSTESELKSAIAEGTEKYIQLTEDITLSTYLDIDGKSVTIDLNGHKLSRSLTSYGSDGHVIWVHNGSDLTLTSSVPGGRIEGGKANNGGAIHIPYGNTVTATNVIFQNNSAADHAGAIWNNGTLKATDCTFANNMANDVGAIYNSKTDSGCGTASLKNCTFSGNVGYTGAGALANAAGVTVMTLDGCTIQNNTAGGHGGGVWNGGMVSATNSTFKNNTANDVGAVYNAATSNGGGVAYLTDCTITGNVGTAGAGALANAVGNTVMTIDGCTITDNTAGSNGGGIWNGGTLKMQGVVTVTGNKKAYSVASNVFLKDGTVITVYGDLAGSIGVELESTTGTFTWGWGGMDPATIFTADFSVALNLVLDDNGEASLTNNGAVYYVERSWDADNKQVVNTLKGLAGSKIGYGDVPVEGQYKEVTNAPANAPFEWFQMGGYSNSDEYYVVRGNVYRETIVVLGKNVHLILCDNATLTLTGGLKLEDKRKLFIHCQSYDNDKMGRLMVTNKYDKAAGIGSAQHEGKSLHAGVLAIHGGHIEATGGDYGAGIGSCARIQEQKGELCDSVTVFGGYVKAIGGKSGAGIGGGSGYLSRGVSGGVFVLYDGTVIAQGGDEAAGVGGGGSYAPLFYGGDGGWGAEVFVFGGTLTATGGKKGAGIGSGILGEWDWRTIMHMTGNKVIIKGGTVTANGGKYAAGIGGGYKGGGAVVNVSGGTVTAYGGTDAAGIGGGEEGYGGKLTISGGTVYAYGNDCGAGIGGGEKGDGGEVTITGGIVIAKAGNPRQWAIGQGEGNYFGYGTLNIGEKMMVGAGDEDSLERILEVGERVNAWWHHSYVMIMPCSHPGATYTVSGTDVNGTHTKHCSHCTTAFAAEAHNLDETGECGVCHFKGTSYTVTIYLPDAKDDDTYTTDGVYKSYTYDIVAGTSFTLPGAPQDLQDMMFAGWLATTTEGTPSFSSYKASDEEMSLLLVERTPYTLNGNVTFVARYKDIAISLADDADNYETIFNFDGKVASSVTLAGRTFYKDGNWNTLCLPFAVTDGDEADGVTFSGTPLQGATVLTLDNATFERNILTLNFEETTAMEPGKPYLIKWANDSEHPTIVNPVFNNVVVSNTSTTDNAVVAGFVSFSGHYAPLNIGEKGDPATLYLADDNTFRYPKGAMNINAFRAYFDANTSLGDVNGDETINVTDVTLLVDYILGKEPDESFIFKNADITRDGNISVTDVTALTDIILGGNSILKVVVNGAEGLSFGGGGSGPARAGKNLK